MPIRLPALSLVVLVGPSGAGKSTFARRHFLPTEVVSSDYCRGVVSDDENDQTATNAAFEVLHFIAAKRLAGGRLTVIDATNVHAEGRRQLIDLATAEQCSASAVQATREHLIHQYGTLSGRRLRDRTDVYAIDEIIEKPNPTQAELRLQVPGLRAGHYLCFFGMHVLTPTVFGLLDDLVSRDVREGGSIQLTTAQNALAGRERYLALETRGTRHNLGVKYGLVEAQIAMALAGVDRERMLAGLLESVVRFDQRPKGE